MLTVETQNTVDSPEFAKLDIQSAAQLAYAEANIQSMRTIDCVIRLVDEREGQALNKQFRQKDKATNVLSFAYDATELPLEADSEPDYLGDIVICEPVIQQEAEQQGKTYEAHLTHMIVHGILHLCGYDHEISADAEQMEQLEVKILAKLNIENPYLRA